MIIYLIIFCLLFSYLLGSLPTAVWVGEAYFGIDIRNHGSGNAGATNTFRILGKKAGIIVLVIDIIKGWSATSLATFLLAVNMIPYDDLIFYKIIFGTAAVLGHILPVYAKFKGGKGIATLVAVIFSINIEAALLCMAIFFIVLVISRYVSLGSLMAALAFPLLLLLPWFYPDEPFIITFAFALFAIVVLTHQKNIKRLINGQESKANIRLRKNKD